MNIRCADEAGILHRLGKAVAARGAGRLAAVLRPVLAEAFPADGLVARLSVLAAEPAALIAEKLNLFLQCLRQSVQLVKCLVQTKVRHNVPKRVARQLLPELRKCGQDLGGRGDEVKLRVFRLQMAQQPLRVDDDAAARPTPGEKPAKRVALPVGEVFLPQEGIAECQPW